jgi:hypothetical protein
MLPKYLKNAPINIHIKHSKKLDILISPSLNNYLNNSIMQLSEDSSLLNSFININKVISPYKYIYSKIPNTNNSISKIPNQPIFFYIFIELIHICNLFDLFNKNIECVHISPYNDTLIDCINLIRENYDDTHSKIENITDTNSIDFISFDLSESFTSINNYIKSLIYSLSIIYTYQKSNGVAIIKIDHMFYKSIIDIVFLLNSMYKNVYIVKPNVSNIINNEMYIVCKHFIVDPIYKTYLDKLSDITYTDNICSIIDEDIPYYFLNKIEESNIIIYHQKIQYIDQIINAIHNSNKIETFKKHNIQKCIQWCEKYKIPHNKINDKINIFLQIVPDNHLLTVLLNNNCAIFNNYLQLYTIVIYDTIEDSTKIESTGVIESIEEKEVHLVSIMPL